eukprot:UN27693
MKYFVSIPASVSNEKFSFPVASQLGQVNGELRKYLVEVMWKHPNQANSKELVSCFSFLLLALQHHGHLTESILQPENEQPGKSLLFAIEKVLGSSSQYKDFPQILVKAIGIFNVILVQDWFNAGKWESFWNDKRILEKVTDILVNFKDDVNNDDRDCFYYDIRALCFQSITNELRVHLQVPDLSKERKNIITGILRDYSERRVLKYWSNTIFKKPWDETELKVMEQHFLQLGIDMKSCLTEENNDALYTYNMDTFKILFRSSPNTKDLEEDIVLKKYRRQTGTKQKIILNNSLYPRGKNLCWQFASMFHLPLNWHH